MKERGFKTAKLRVKNKALKDISGISK